ncbi:pilus assembly protein [[Haemophilus] ducreyi]
MRKYVITQTKRFIQNQSGVYIIFGALLTLPIVALLFVSLEVAGIIQDKARLNDALEQAVLSLTAENNSGRKSYDYALTNAEKANGKYLADSEAGKRDSQIVKTFVKLYLPQIDENTMKFEPICTTQNNAITPKNGKQYAYSSSHVTCTVTGSINHRSLFPMTVGKSKIIPEQVSLSSGSMAQKINNVNLPLDLMVVADLSGSMDYNINNHKVYSNTEASKLTLLKQVLEELTDKYLLSEEANPNNRISMIPFAMGAQHPIRNSCVLPFEWNQSHIGYNDSQKVSPNEIEYNLRNLPIRSRTIFTHNLVYLLDTKKTLEKIGTRFNNYDVEYQKSAICLEGSDKFQQQWYEKNQKINFINEVKRLKAAGATLASSGLIVAVNNMLNEPARSDVLKQQTRRTILILSDGSDSIGDDSGENNWYQKEIPFMNFSRITENLILGKQELFNKSPQSKNLKNHIYGYRYNYPIYLTNNTEKIQTKGLCDVIRDKLNTKNKDNNTKIIFVELGYNSSSKDTWLHCVGGTQNYYSATSKESLLEAFKQAISKSDDIGHNMNGSDPKKK